MKRNKSSYIAIVMEGGIIQNVCTNDKSIDVVVLDYDAFEAGDPPVWEERTQLIHVPLSDDMVARSNEHTSFKEEEVIAALKQLGY